MSRNQPRWGHWESNVKEIKYPESSFLSECRSLSSQASKEQKMPSLRSDHKYLNNKASGRSLGCFPFESNWRSALLKTERIKKEYSSTFGLRDCEESAAISNLTQGVQTYQENPSSILQMKKGFAYGAAKPFPTSEDDHHFVPASDILPQTSSQYLGYEFCKNRGDVPVVDLQKRGLDFWNPSPLKMPAIHDGGGEIGALSKSFKCRQGLKWQSTGESHMWKRICTKGKWRRDVGGKDQTVLCSSGKKLLLEMDWFDLPPPDPKVLSAEKSQNRYINSKTFHCDIYRSKKNNHISSICSLPAGPRYKFGHHHFTDPFAGAPPEYIHRLSEIKSFQCETIRQEQNKKLKRGKKEETWTS